MKPIAPLALFILIAVLSTTLLEACSNDENDDTYSLRMKDNNVIKIDKTSTLDIESEALKSTRDSLPYKVGEPDSIFGYTNCDSASNWQTTKVGEWATKYGLSTDKEYISRIEYYFKEIPMRSDELFCFYLPKQAKMGLEAENCTISYKTYTRPNLKHPLRIGCLENAYTGNYKGNSIAYTAIIHIKYDSDGNAIDVYYPCKPEELAWYFTRFTLNDIL